MVFCVTYLFIYLFISDTLVKLMEYGEDDDDLDDSSEESLPHATRAIGVQKPFWALWAIKFRCWKQEM